MKTEQSAIKKLISEGGIAEIIGKSELEKKLLSGKKLIVKFGADPTRPDLHLGHAVILRKLREFQDLGHKVVFLIGDATTKIGDPTGKDKTRPVTSDAEIKKNAITYVRQAAKILKTDKKILEVRYNSEWFSKMKFYDFLKLMTMTTLARVAERDMFQQRMKSGKDVGLHELVYPVMQGYDSVELKADVVLLGSDQKFNELFGRHYQEKFGQAPQCMVITKILVGIDGKEKMSKSLDNYIGISESADQIYGKVMSIPDSAMSEYFNLATGLEYKKINIKNPRDRKMKLAYEIVKLYHGERSATKAQENFVNVFQRKGVPKKISSFVISSAVSKSFADEIKLVGGDNVSERNIKLTQFMVNTKLATSFSDARRKIEQGGVSIDGERIMDYKFELNKRDYNNKIIKVGKLNFCKIVFK